MASKRKQSGWTITGPYEGGKFCLIETVGGEQYARGMRDSRAECRALFREINERRAAEQVSA